MKSVFPSLCLLMALAFCQSAFGQNEEFDPIFAAGMTPPSLADNRAAKNAVSSIDTLEYGRMTATVDIDEAGNVSRVRSISGPGNVCPSTTRAGVTELRNAVISAAKTVRFNPAKLNGRPVQSSGRLYFFIDKRPRPPVPLGDEPERFTVQNPQQGNSSGNTAGEGSKDKPLMGVRAPLPPNYTSVPSVVGSGPTSSDSDSAKGQPTRLTVVGDKSPSDGGQGLRGDVLNGKALSLPRPRYPQAARAVQASGPVLIQVIIDEDGTIYSATATSGHPLLHTASRIAACEAKFAPTLLEGKPVKVQGVITYNFVAP